MHSRIHAEILAHARGRPAEEVCGFILHDVAGRPFTFPCRNVAEDPTTDFEIDANEHVAALQAGMLLGAYHSHPGEPAGFSPGDLLWAEELALPIYLLNTEPDTLHDYVPPTYTPPLEGRRWVLGFHDCWETPRIHYRQALGVHMSDYERDESFSHEGKGTILSNYEREGFIQLPPDPAALREHDILMFRTDKALPQHFGVFRGKSRFVHHLQNGLSCPQQLDTSWLKRLHCVFRHRNLI